MPQEKETILPGVVFKNGARIYDVESALALSPHGEGTEIHLPGGSLIVSETPAEVAKILAE